MNDNTDFEDGLPRDVVKPSPSVFPFGFRTGRSNDILFLDFLDDKGSHVEVISSTALDFKMAVDVREKLDEFINSILESSENGEE
jgi:hypothetical protein